MRHTTTLLAIAVVLFAISDNLAAASKANNGFYADLYNVENGVVTDKIRVPLGDVGQYKESDFKQLRNSLTKSQEERAAVHLPRGFNSLIRGVEKFAKLFSRGPRRLRIEEA